MITHLYNLKFSVDYQKSPRLFNTSRCFIFLLEQGICQTSDSPWSAVWAVANTWIRQCQVHMGAVPLPAGAECCFISADASPELQPQILGSLQLAEAHGYPAVPLSALGCCPFDSTTCGAGRGGENPPAWTALHLTRHLCFITKMLLHSSDILLLLILIKYLTALKWERWRKTCNALSDCLLSLTCN